MSLAHNWEQILNRLNITSILVDSHGAVTLSIDYISSVGAVDRNLVIISTESVPVGVGIGEESALKHLIDGGLHAGNEVAGREGGLLSLGKIVFRIFVDDELSNGDQRVISLRDNFGDIE